MLLAPTISLAKVALEPTVHLAKEVVKESACAISLSAPAYNEEEDHYS